MKRLRFRTRLIFGFSILLLASITIVFMAGYQIRLLSKDADLLYKHPFIVSNATRDIKININAIHRSMKDVVLADNPEQIDEYNLLISSYDSLIIASFDIIEERFLGDKLVVENIRQFYMDWEKIRKEVIDLKMAGKDTEAAYITKNKGAKHVNDLLGKTNYLIDFAKEKADAFYAETVKRKQKSILTLSVVAILILLFGIAVSIIISRSISKPIHDFILKVKHLYQKEHPEQSGLKRSEQDIFESTAVEIKEAYNLLETFNQELDRKVNERTKELEDSKLKLLGNYKEISALNDEYSAQNEEYLALNEEYRTQNEELRKAKDRAEESDRLKSAFLANMSHEVRTPLNSILGFSEVLKMGGLTDKDKERYLDLIITGGRSLLSIISDIVDFSKINANQLRIILDDCNLNKVIDHLYYQFSVSKVNPNITLTSTKSLDDDSCIIVTDRNRLMQILSNLMENALKFTVTGEIDFGYTVDGNELKLYVRDTGIGISKSDQEKIFDRFIRIENQKIENRSGTGLGLSIVKGLVELLGSKICVESEVGKGATFYFIMPFEPNSYSKERNNVNEGMLIQKQPNEDVVVLIAEDEEVNFMYLEAVLKPYKFKIIHAENGKRAVEIFKEQKRIDMVLMDIKMPEMGGLEATREIRKINTKTPIIAQTAYAMSEDREVALASGCNDFLAKPLSYSQIEGVIKRYIK